MYSLLEGWSNTVRIQLRLPNKLLILLTAAMVLLTFSDQMAAEEYELVDLVQLQKFEQVEELLSNREVDVNIPQADGATALAWSVHWNNHELTAELIRHGADVNSANELGVTPLMLAALNGSNTMVSSLLDSGAMARMSRPSGETALMMAARVGNTEILQLLTKAGANPNASTTAGYTALMWAVSEGHTKAAQILIDAGAAVIDVRTHFNPPTQRTYGSGARELVLLREGEAANPAEFPRDGDGDPPRTVGGFTPLLYGVLGGHLDTVRVLVAEGSDVNEASPDGVSALMLALTKRHEDLALFLLNQGADPNYDPRANMLNSNEFLADGQDPLADTNPQPLVDFAGYTALHLAAATSQHNALRTLLEMGAEPDARMDRPKRFIRAFEIGVFTAPGAGRMTNVGSTPFMIAAKSADAIAMRILADYGADPLATTTDGTTALALAAGLGKRAATDINYYEWTETKAVDAVQAALDLGVDINATNEWKETALHGATYHAAENLIRFLIDNGADIDSTDWEDQTPLRVAKGHMICCTTYAEHPHIAELLLELGADPEAGKQVTFGLLGYHSENKDDSPSPSTESTSAEERRQ